MRRLRKIIGPLIVGIVPAITLFIPLGVALAQSTAVGLVSCSSPEGTGSVACNLCGMVTTAQNVINFAIVIAMPIAAVLFGWAGFLYMTSGIYSSQIATAHKIFKSAAIGFAVVLCGWLIVNTIINEVILKHNSGYFSEVGGTWYKLPECKGARETKKLVSHLLYGVFAPGKPVTITSVTPAAGAAPVCSGTSKAVGSGCYNESSGKFELPSNHSCGSATFDSATGGCKTSDGLTYVPTITGGTTVPSGDIAAAASAYQGTPTNLGPDGGNLACAWAVNNVLNNAGISSIDGNSVSNMQTELQSGRGTAVETAAAQPGDIIIWKGSGVSHVGICQTAGCTSAISNSSSKASFSNISGSTFSGVSGQIYRVNR